VDINVRVRGPLFDGKASAELGRFLSAAERAVAEEGVRVVRAELKTVLRHPTGYYSSRITAAPSGTAYAVTDQGVSYGPWLAGTGSRNRTTRFKGYQHWRRATQRLERLSGEVASRVLPPFLRRMN
jgi:hypothetical protein